MSPSQIKIAEKIIRRYNRAIREVQATLYAHPRSALGYNKTQIKQAIRAAPLGAQCR